MQIVRANTIAVMSLTLLCYIRDETWCENTWLLYVQGVLEKSFSLLKDINWNSIFFTKHPVFEHWVSSWKFQQREVWEAELTDVKIFLLKLVIKLPLIAGCKLSWDEWPKTKARTSSPISLQIMHFPSFCCCMEDTARKGFICVWITMPGLCLFMYNGPTESKRNILLISSILELSIVSSYY